MSLAHDSRLHAHARHNGHQGETGARDSLGVFAPPQRVAAATGDVEAATLSADGRSLYFHKLENGRFVIYRASR